MAPAFIRSHRSADFPQVRRAPSIISTVWLLEIREKFTQSKFKTHLHFNPSKTWNSSGTSRERITSKPRPPTSNPNPLPSRGGGRRALLLQPFLPSRGTSRRRLLLSPSSGRPNGSGRRPLPEASLISHRWPLHPELTPFPDRRPR
jgi:hypothetical protein